MPGFGDIISRTMDVIRDRKNPELDKTKAALDDLKKLMDQNPEAAPSEKAIQLVRSQFELDCDELDINDPAQKETLWKSIEAEVKRGVLERTPEFQQLDSFTKNLENMAGLRQIIDDKNPKEKAKGWAKKTLGALSAVPLIGPLLGDMKMETLGKWLSEWADDMKEENDKKKDTVFSKIIRKVAGWLGYEKPAELTRAVASADQPAAAAGEKAPGQPAETQEKEVKEPAEAFEADDIESVKAEQSSEWTLCSKSAKLNLLELNQNLVILQVPPNVTETKMKEYIENVKEGHIKTSEGKIVKLDQIVPQGNADDVRDFYSLVSAEKFSGTSDKILQQLNESGKNLCDVIVSADNKYGHRAAGFLGKDSSGNLDWYILDPYRNKSQKPVKLSEYAQDKVITVVPVGHGKTDAKKVESQA